MKSKQLLLLGIVALSSLLLAGCEMVVFQPQGPVAQSILDLINWSIIWMLLVVVVVFGLFGYIVWKYRERPENMDYEPPEEHGSTLLEIIWIGIPILIVIALTIPTVKTLYQLEEIPEGYEEKEPITIHVTAADWKWIFSYPEQGIETVNYVNFPVNTPIHFKLTSASTMQSFWIPALGGQKYAMGKMETEMYLVADYPGSYLGKNTNFNGRGYAQMEFEALAQTQKDFDEWVTEVKETAPELTEEKYEELLKPTHLGRMTFTNTHLEWVNHALADSKTYTHPELYRYHGYQGRIFEEEDNYRNQNQSKHQLQQNYKKNTDINKNNHDKHDHDEHEHEHEGQEEEAGGEHHGH